MTVSLALPVGPSRAFARQGDTMTDGLVLQPGELIGQPGPPAAAAIAEIRARHDIQQLTPMSVGRPR